MTDWSSWRELPGGCGYSRQSLTQENISGPVPAMPYWVKLSTVKLTTSIASGLRGRPSRPRVSPASPAMTLMMLMVSLNSSRRSVVPQPVALTSELFWLRLRSRANSLFLQSLRPRAPRTVPSSICCQAELGTGVSVAFVCSEEPQAATAKMVIAIAVMVATRSIEKRRLRVNCMLGVPTYLFYHIYIIMSNTLLSQCPLV